MLPSFIITFRETLEAAIIVGIILAYLVKTKKERYNNIVYIGIAAAVLASIIGAILFNNLAGGFTGRAEEIFEGIAMLAAAVLVTVMILWMLKQKKVVQQIHSRVDAFKRRRELFLLVFISVFREGIETVIFLGAAGFATGAGASILGALSGIFLAILFGYLIFVAGKKINIKTFLSISSIILILFAAGLTAHGVHEFQEAGIIPIISEHVFDINPPDENHILHENGLIGSILKGLFGYNGNPNLLEILAYFAYLGVFFILYKRTSSKKIISS